LCAITLLLIVWLRLDGYHVGIEGRRSGDKESDKDNIKQENS